MDHARSRRHTTVEYNSAFIKWYFLHLGWSLLARLVDIWLFCTWTAQIVLCMLSSCGKENRLSRPILPSPWDHSRFPHQFFLSFLPTVSLFLCYHVLCSVVLPRLYKTAFLHLQTRASQESIIKGDKIKQPLREAVVAMETGPAGKKALWDKVCGRGLCG